MSTQQSQDNFQEQINKSQLTDTQQDVLEYWSQNLDATLKEFEHDVGVAGATASNTIRLYGWLYNEAEWRDRSWKGDPEEVKRQAVNKRRSKTSSSTTSSSSTNSTETNNDPDTQGLGNRPDNSWSVGPPLNEIEGIQTLRSRMQNCTNDSGWTDILNDYIEWGNNTMINNTVGIFNLCSGHYCPNRFTGHCQVGGDECYIVQHEKIYQHALDYYNRQEYLWDRINADTFVDSFIELNERRSIDTKALKFNQAGDFRCNQDVFKVNRIAEKLSEYNIKVFTYSASNWLDWDIADSDNLAVNQSNSIEEYGDRRFKAVDSVEDIPDDFVWCIYNRQDEEGVPLEERTKCGDCMMCVDDNAPDIAVVK